MGPGSDGFMVRAGSKCECVHKAVEVLSHSYNTFGHYLELLEKKESQC